MKRSLTFLALILVLLAPLMPLATPRPVAAAETEQELVPLRRICLRGTPDATGQSSCCISGYVFVGGRPVADARVTVTLGSRTAVVWTEPAYPGGVPFYDLDLSQELQAIPGDRVTLTVEFSGFRYSSTHTVLAGGQQVDLTIPLNSRDGFVYERQIWQQGREKEFNFPVGVALDAFGNLFVVDRDNARVQVFTADDKLGFKYTWGRQRGSTPGEFVFPHGVAVDRRGFVYVADRDNHRLQRFTSTGLEPTSIGRFGKPDDETATTGPLLDDPVGVAVDSANNIYVADQDNHRVLKVDGDGRRVASFPQTPEFSSAPGKLKSPNGVVVAPNGTVFVADTGNNRIQVFDQNGTFVRGWSGAEGGGRALAQPAAITLAPDGSVVVADTGNSLVRVFSPEGIQVRTLGEGNLLSPRGVVVDKDGFLFVADTGRHRVLRIALTTGAITASVGTWSRSDGQLGGPRGIDTDSAGNIYIADSANHRIQKFSPDGRWLNSWGERGPDNLQFLNPEAVTVSPDGARIYVSDTGNHRIQQLTGTGQFVRVIGLGRGNLPGQLQQPLGLDLDPAGNIYVADRGNNRVQKFSPTGEPLASWGESGSGPRQFSLPTGVAVDKNGVIFVADDGNHRVQRLAPNGDFEAEWGTQGSNANQFNGLAGINVDQNGDVYVADRCNYRIKRFTGSGTLRSVWGGFGSGPGVFTCMAGVAVDLQGNVYASDVTANRVQRFRPIGDVNPVATIVNVKSERAGSVVVQNDKVEFTGLGSDSLRAENATAYVSLPVTYSWSVDGPRASRVFGTTPSATLDTATLEPGDYTISFTVTSTQRARAAVERLTLTVTPEQGFDTNWGFLLYLSGEDPSLTDYLSRNSNRGVIRRLEERAPNPNVQIFGLYDGPGVNDTFEFLIDSDGTFQDFPRPEANMGSRERLERFIRDGQDLIKANHYYLAIADHANALTGIVLDRTTVPPDRLTNAELREALLNGTENGARRIDVLHLDGCLMGLVEVAYQLEGLADYLIVSQNQGWSAFAYDDYRQQVLATTDAPALVRQIVQQYKTIVSRQRYPFTISALDMGAIRPVVDSVSRLSTELERYVRVDPPARQAILEQLRTQAQKFDSNNRDGITEADEYVDLIDLLSRIRSTVTGDQDLTITLNGLLDQHLPRFVMANEKASGVYENRNYPLDRAGGVSIYYPPATSRATFEIYQTSLTFGRATRWVDFLNSGLRPTSHNEDVVTVPDSVAPLPITRKEYVHLPLVRRR